MKKTSVILLSIITLTSITSCNNTKETLNFTQDSYELKSGEKISVKENKKNIKYELITNKYNEINLNEDTGIFTFTDSIPNYTQVMAIAKLNDLVSNPVVVTLYYDYQASDVNFTNMSSYIVNNEYINAKSSKNYSVSYELKEEVNGITIENETGKVTFSPIVTNNTKFTVIANSHGSKTEKEFIAMTEGFVEAKVARQALEKGNSSFSAFYELDFSKSDVENNEIIAIVDSLNSPISKDYYEYNKQKNILKISPAILDNLSVGMNKFKVITERNSVEITLDVVTKFISTAEDLASINNSKEALSGYYILLNDIDLEEYVASHDNGWTPIGKYKDTLDSNIATEYSFKGTFDGNGHIIKNMNAALKGEISFNAGLFGYITSSATIKNLGVQGELSTSSYSGGFVGSNNGLIENCFANVNISANSGEEAYRYVGGFVGNNFGTIRNCYSIGNIDSETYFGNFVGSNTGILENCFALKSENCDNLIGYGSSSDTSKQFENEEDMKNYNFQEFFNEEYWSFNQNEYPSLKSTLIEKNVRGIKIEIDKNKYFKKDEIIVYANIYPSNLHDNYIENVEYEIVEGNNFIINPYYNPLFSRKIITSSSLDDSLTIKATLKYNDITYEDQITINLNNRIDSLSINYDENFTFEAGKSYRLNAEFEPLIATNDIITYKLSKEYLGAKLENNILTINEEFGISNSSNSISFYAESESGIRTPTYNIKVKTKKIISNKVKKIYNDDNLNFEYLFDNSLNLENIKVSIFGKDFSNYQIDNNTLIIPKASLENFKDTLVHIYVTINEDVYLLDAYYFNHDKYSLDNIENDVIKINNIEDYFKYFNANPNEIDSNKWKNYDKKYVLTADLDFNGQELLAIGDGKHKFSGTLYGMGHTISNFKIYRNEGSSSNTYGIGLFGISSGSFYDINIHDFEVTSDGNFAGGLVGMLAGGYIENCNTSGENVNVYIKRNIKGENVIFNYSLDGIQVGKIAGKNNNGKIIATYHNNTHLDTIG